MANLEETSSTILIETMYAHFCRYKCGHLNIAELFDEWERLLGMTKDEPLNLQEASQNESSSVALIHLDRSMN